MLRFSILCLTVAATIVGNGLSAAEVDAQGAKFFEKKIRPVLVQSCYECHSAKSKELGGKLRLDTKAGLLAGGESGPVVVAGDPKQSVLMKALRYEGLEMPPKNRLPESVVGDFQKWIQMGAPDPRADEPLAADAAPVAGINIEEGRQFWSFQPLAKTTPPQTADKAWPRGPIDQYILAQLEAANLAPARDADLPTLARRLSYDLTGLPPSAERIATLVASAGKGGPQDKTGQQAIATYVDELLASPRFGEHWARHWLDIARYGESNGNVRNATFPHAWRYRDYVIKSLNDDKPYDEFISEQIAGDLLPAASTEERNEHLVATGFLAVGSKPNANGNPNFRMDLVADQIEVVTTSLMGLTVACARCHDHKYDPVPTRDYYALAGIFTSTEVLYGATGNTMGGAPPTELHALAVDGAVKPVVIATEKIPDDLQPKKNKNKKGKGAGNLAKYEPGTPLAMGVREKPATEECRINIKGEARDLGASVPRGFVQVCSLTAPQAIDPQQSGRLQLAQWLTQPEHPLTSRVMVNRIWHHLFGTGIVRTPDNFGLHGERPSHPELLDYLAHEFMTSGDGRPAWSVKRMIRAIVLTRAYQLSTAFNANAAEQDPDNSLVWRHQRRRLDAEAFRDSVLTVSGQMNLTPQTGSILAKLGEVLIQDKLTPDKIQKPSNHRSIYLCLMRSGEPEELVVFDLADPSLIVGARNVTTVPSQALFLLNSPFMLGESQHFAERLLADAAGDKKMDDDVSRIRRAYQLALLRQPTDAELERAKDFFETSTAAQRTPVQIWAGFCQSLFATNEFRYLD